MMYCICMCIYEDCLNRYLKKKKGVFTDIPGGLNFQSLSVQKTN